MHDSRRCKADSKEEKCFAHTDAQGLMVGKVELRRLIDAQDMVVRGDFGMAS